MKWALCGLTFALCVALAVATASFRATNLRLRSELELQYRSLEAHDIELRRLSLLAAEQATPERLCEQLRALLQKGGPVRPQESASWQ